MENTVFFEPKRWWIYHIYWLVKSLVLDFLLMENAVFFQLKSWWKDEISLVFWHFHDILGLGKYGFSCSDTSKVYLEIYISYVKSHLHFLIAKSLYYQPLTVHWMINRDTLKPWYVCKFDLFAYVLGLVRLGMAENDRNIKHLKRQSKGNFWKWWATRTSSWK